MRGDGIHLYLYIITRAVSINVTHDREVILTSRYGRQAWIGMGCTALHPAHTDNTVVVGAYESKVHELNMPH